MPTQSLDAARVRRTLLHRPDDIRSAWNYYSEFLDSRVYQDTSCRRKHATANALKNELSRWASTWPTSSGESRINPTPTRFRTTSGSHYPCSRAILTALATLHVADVACLCCLSRPFWGVRRVLSCPHGRRLDYLGGPSRFRFPLPVSGVYNLVTLYHEACPMSAHVVAARRCTFCAGDTSARAQREAEGAWEAGANISGHAGTTPVCPQWGSGPRYARVAL